MTKITVQTEIDLTTEVVAKWFCGLNDEQQADFFIAASNEAKNWGIGQSLQWFMVGRHLSTCECSTYEAQDMIKELHNGLNNV